MTMYKSMSFSVIAFEKKKTCLFLFHSLMFPPPRLVVQTITPFKKFSSLHQTLVEDCEGDPLDRKT